MSQRIRAGVTRLFRLALRRPGLAEEEMDAELRFHLESRIDQLMARGLSREAAQTEALRRLGSDTPSVQARLRKSAEQRERRMGLLEWTSDLLMDLRYAARGLRQRPGFTSLAVATLAIGIGATTAIFSAVDALLLRPLPFLEPERLIQVRLLGPSSDPGSPLVEKSWSYPKYLAFRDAQQEYQRLALYVGWTFTITDSEAERLAGEAIGAEYLGALGIPPARGRSFLDEEDAPGSRRVAILGDALWRRRFGADPDVVGRTIHVDREPYEIVGVAPPGFGGLTGRAEIFVPFTAVISTDDLSHPYSHTFQLVGRLKPHVSEAEAERTAVRHGERVHEAFPLGAGFAGSGRWSAEAVPLDAIRVSPIVGRGLYVLMGAVGFVLLITCSNLASLLLGRGAARRREMAVRQAIGAGRRRLVRQLLVESMLLAGLGGAASLLVAHWVTGVLSGINPASTLQAQRLDGLGAVDFSSIHLDGTAFLFALGVTLLVGVLFGLMPALHATSLTLTAALKDGAAPRRLTSRRVLVVLETGLALVLLAGSGLMLQSLARLTRVDPGFDPARILTFQLAIPRGALARDSLPGFYSDLLGRLGALPGATAVAIGDCAPLSGGCNGTGVEVLDRPPAPGVPPADVGVHWTSPEWFGALGVPLTRGRLFDATDRLGTPKVVLLSESAAQRVFADEDPIGRRVRIGQGGFQDGATVVGVVGDVRFNRLHTPAEPDVYLPYHQSPRTRMIVYLRAAGDPSGLIPPARRAVRELAPEAPLYDIQTMTARVAAASAQTRYSALLLAAFSAVALVLAAIGIYGVMAFAVAQRSREIGVRMALGATRGRVLGLILREGAVLGLAGGALGLAGAFALTRLLRGLLFEVSPSDPATYAAMLLVLGAAVLLASWLPARRAARVDPSVSLRTE